MDKFFDWLLERLRFLFSPETVLSIPVFFLLCKVPAIYDWIYTPFALSDEYMAIASLNDALQKYEQHKNLESLRLLVIYLLVFAVLLGIGELMRRKLNRKSLLFYNRKN